jgi:hypothetical protein
MVQSIGRRPSVAGNPGRALRFLQGHKDATGAYRRAGYKARGNAAEANAPRLLRKAKVQAAIQATYAERARRVSGSPSKRSRGAVANTFNWWSSSYISKPGSYSG